MAVRRNSGANSSWKKNGRKKIVQIIFFEKKFSKKICWKKKLKKIVEIIFSKKKIPQKICQKKIFVQKILSEKKFLKKILSKKFFFNGLVFAPLMDQNLTLKLNFTFKGRVNQHQNQ